MTKVKKVLSSLNNKQTFIVVMTAIIGLLALAFKYPEHAPACIKAIGFMGIGV